MLIKWMACHVVDREAFDRGQRAWADLRGLPGFLGQCGGWSRRDDRLAQVLGFWADESSHQAFMTGPHDGMAAAQSVSYDAIEVRLFDRLLDVGDGFPVDAGGTALIRRAHCHVRPGRQAHFVDAQTSVWNPGMVAAPGATGGVFARRGDAEFLVLTGWRSDADHEAYLRNDVEDLRRRSGAADDLEAIFGDLVDVEPTWTVPAQAGDACGDGSPRPTVVPG